MPEETTRARSVEPLRRLEEFVRLYQRTSSFTRISGHVTEVSPSFLRVAGLSCFVKIGECVRVHDGAQSSLAQIVRIDDRGVVAKSFDNSNHAGLGSRVDHVGPLSIAPDASWANRVLNAFGAPIDGRGFLAEGARVYPVDARAPQALTREKITKSIRTGIRAIDAFTPLCLGQRIGVFAGSGVGKTTLLSMLARTEGFSVAVVCLVGERGREVGDFLDMIAAHRKASTITVVATADESAMMRRLAPLTATAVAEAFRDQGESVILIVDSITRYAHAAREVALAAGEPAVANGYTPSVFAELPRLLERTGPGHKSGSITGIYSVLLDADNTNDPIADCIRGTLDGHIILDRHIAEQGRYPAVDVLRSISRLADRAWSPKEREFVMSLKALLFRYEETRDLRMLGGYQAGLDQELDKAIAAAPRIYNALRQAPEDALSVAALQELAFNLGPQ